jgi:hypothetical protein
MKKHFQIAMWAMSMIVLLFSCKEEEEMEPYLTFSLNGVPRTFVMGGQFSRDFCDYSTNCCHFFADANKSNIYSIQIGIPGDAIVGHKYVNGEYRFVLRYHDATDHYYDLAKEGSCELMLTGWEGPGGWATGIFSGKVVFDATDSLVITGANFRARISSN